MDFISLRSNNKAIKLGTVALLLLRKEMKSITDQYEMPLDTK